MNRRDFLRTTAVGVAGLCLPNAPVRPLFLEEVLRDGLKQMWEHDIYLFTSENVIHLPGLFSFPVSDPVMPSFSAEDIIIED